MKAYLNERKAAAKSFISHLQQAAIFDFNLSKRLIVLLLMTALLMPIVYLGDWQKAAAQSGSLLSQISSPVSAPPEQYYSAYSNNFQTTTFSAIASMNAFVGGGYTSVIGFFTAPPLPVGFEGATTISPASAAIASAGSSINSLLGFFLPSAAADSTTNNKNYKENNNEESAEPNTLPLTAAGTVKFDFDGDGKADIARWRSALKQWEFRNSSNGSFTTIASSSSGQIAPADYDGSGTTDAAVFNAGTWKIKTSPTAAEQVITGFGLAGDKVVSGNYVGTSAADLALYRNGTWYVKNLTDGQVTSTPFGVAGDIPVPGNYDGDALMDYAVYRPSTGDWHVSGSSAGYFVFHWGNATDIPVPADFDGDGKTDYAVFRGSSGTWYIYYSNGNPYHVQNWGNYGDQPTVADYDGDGKADVSVWRPSNGVWYNYKSSTGGYESVAFGVTDDQAVPSAYLKQIGSEVYSYDFARTRLSPKNATGGTNLYSQNFSWGTGLVNLPGRAGLDAGLGISYNSLVWTKDGSAMVFDADNGNVSPGFRFGYPTIEPGYYDATSQKFNYLMITPSGGRVEFKQQGGAAGIYETVDSSYTQLRINAGGNPNSPPSELTMTLTGTDGTQMLYVWVGGAYRCAEIKDSNGNYITVGYDEFGALRNVTDTLGRVITVDYDGDYNPTVIRQNWQANNGSGTAQNHVYATFNYAFVPMNPNFGSLTVYGPSGVWIKVLQSIVYTDGSSTKFDYNAYGQVYKVSNIAADSPSNVLNYVKTDLESVSGEQTDCPRFTVTRSTINDFNGGTNTETVVHNEIAANQPYVIEGVTRTATRIKVWMDNHPNGLISKTYVGASGWTEGLPLATEDCVSDTCGGADRKRWTRTVWTQDDTTVTNGNPFPYILNPRVTESKVGDTTNTKRTTVSYHPQFGLVNEVKVYDTNQTTELKKSVTTYNLASAYTSRRIIGLPLESKSYGSDGTTLSLLSKVTYLYDEGDFTTATALNQNIAPVRHDTINYGANFIVGRGNLTSATRYDAAEQNPVTSTIKYNTAGAVVSQITPGTSSSEPREVKLSYTDSFNDGAGRTSFAYPTKITDPAGNFSEVKYRYDIGANVWAKSPAPAGNTNGKITERIFDTFGRPEKESVLKNNENNTLAEYAYTRYVYLPNAVQSQVFTTVNDTNNNGLDAADEVMTESWTDGAGRVRKSRTAHPGSIGGWSAAKTEYDIIGRVTSQTVPTEVSVSTTGAWTPAGNDSAWRSTSQLYDWKGRVTKKTNTDGTFSEAAYDGCGCAGGEEVTVEGEELAANSKRKQKIYSDIQGRQYKTETFNYVADGGGVYSSTVTKFNGRDQAEWVKQYVGEAPADALLTDACPIPAAGAAQTCQITKMTYDDYGRVKSQHKPQQDADKATLYDYYPNGEVQKMTDARGATSTYSYNNRGLVTGIEYYMSATANKSTAAVSGSYPTSGSPYGYLDVVDPATWKASGWSLDPDSPNQSTTVHFYIDGTAPGNYAGQTVANIERPDVNTATGQPGNHGFEFIIPNQYLDGNQHTIYAYGLDSGGGNAGLMVGSPKAFTYTPNSIQPTINASVAFEYDAAGNRLWMTDNLGRTDYEYDGLSRLKAETRKFVDTTPNGSPLAMANAPLANNGFKLQYKYGLANQLTELTDPYGAAINYGYDGAGRLKNVTGTSFGGVVNYGRDAEYQAWGALKTLTYADNMQMTMTYNNRLQAASYTLAGGASGGQVMSKNYDYHADGSLRYAQDTLNPIFDRLNNYDHLGRIKQGKTGLEARGTEITDVEQQKTTLPYRQSYGFNAFGNMTQRDNRHWGVDNWQGQSNNLSYDYKNNRIQGAGWSYDADGRNLQTAAPDDYASSIYNAAGQMARSVSEQTDAVRSYDGNGREIKRVTANYTGDSNGQPIWITKTKYYVRSSVLGNEVVSEVWSNGRKAKTFVRAAGSQLAYQTAYASETAALNEAVIFEYSDASGMSQRSSDKTGAVVATGDGGEGSPVETDPMGGNVGTYSPYIELIGGGFEPEPQYPMLQPMFDDAPSYVNGQQQTCTVDGFAVSCSRARDMLQNGSAIPAHLAGLQGLPGFSFQHQGLGIFTVTVPLQVGWHVNPNQSVTPVYSQYSTQSSIFVIPGSWSVPQQTQQNNRRAMTNEEIGKLGKELGDLMNPKCAAFLSKFFNKLAEKYPDKAFDSDGVFALFELFKETAFATNADGGFGFSFGPLTGANGHGGRHQGKPMVRLNNKPEYTNLNIPNKDRMLTLIHELIHNAIARGGSGALRHESMYNLAFDAAEKQGKRLTIDNFTNDPLKDKDRQKLWDNIASMFFGDILKEQCDLK